MSPPGTAHAHAIARLTMLLVQAVGTRALVRVQSPFAASDDSEPQPDLSLVTNEDHWQDHPSRAFLLIDVAEGSLSRDRRIKTRIYERAEIPEYWVVNLADRTVEVRRAPRDGAYAELTVHHPGETIRPQAFPDIEVRVADVVPDAR
jgi:Uma2 family endonuclease